MLATSTSTTGFGGTTAIAGFTGLAAGVDVTGLAVVAVLVTLSALL